jgi:UDP-GlcNAc3NAcA epimerase
MLAFDELLSLGFAIESSDQLIPSIDISQAMHITTVIGARPQFIKAAVVSQAFQKNHPDVRETIIHTGQHYDVNMSDVFFEELNIPRPDHQLKIGGGSHGQNTGRMIEGIESVLLKDRPDWLLVYGDTDSTLAGALAAAKLNIPVAHVEAGLRSFNRAMPEEVNRILTDHVSTKLFAPTVTAITNLAGEGIAGSRVINVGDVMYDAALYFGEMAESTSHILEQLVMSGKEYVPATLHRQENVDDPTRLANILRGLGTSDKPVIMPLHPRTSKRLFEFGIDLPPCITAIDPIGYLDMVMLEKHANAIITDSGGVQKEAYFYGIPCITLRAETEWVELLDARVNILVSDDVTKITNALAESRRFIFPETKLFGTGDASAKVAAGLLL